MNAGGRPGKTEERETMAETLKDLLAPHPAEWPAIGAPGRPWMTYGGLRDLSADVAASLRSNGIGAADRVAIVLPNGPEMAAAFVAIAQAAATAPLNPAYRQEEYEFYLGDLKARALVVEEGYHGPALAAAAKFGLRILRLRGGSGPAGAFTLQAEGSAAPALAGEPGAGDVALILHTSGTTSRPKIVPLLQSNLAASAENIRRTLELRPADRCLNVMPLFHIHGLIAAVSASLGAGASISCAPGFDALRFFGWMNEVRPTWYTAVPTMHQAILARAERNRDVIAATRLRFIRSSSASLPAQVMRALSETFGAPVIEAYGMTEATHQMTSNPLTPGGQVPGSVGREAGPKVRIAHELENRLVQGTGEVVISGPNVTPGYEGNPDANGRNFFMAEGARWFRTGDQGAFDDLGYLRLTGRLKEIINRGGEKISPLEVDDVLLDHPAIAQVVTFAIPHPKLGEEVGAAVVLREGRDATEREIRDFAAGRLADFKVPRRIVIVAEIPKGATGKMQRIGLAEKLGLAGPVEA
nr:acyl--CoA ligase [uncultured Defluviimonas sp.]